MTKKAVNCAEFRELPLAMQLQMLHRDGVHVGKRLVDGSNVILFQLYDFYVEVFYKEYRRDVDHLQAGTDTAILQPYLDQIRIRDLDNDK